MKLPRMRWLIAFSLKHNRKLSDVLNMTNEEVTLYRAYEQTQDPDYVAAYQAEAERELQASLSPDDRMKYIRGKLSRQQRA